MVVTTVEESNTTQASQNMMSIVVHITYDGFSFRWLDLLSVSYTLTLNYTCIQQYSSTADMHTFQITIAHALVLSFSTSRFLTTDLTVQILHINFLLNLLIPHIVNWELWTPSLNYHFYSHDQNFSNYELQSLPTLDVTHGQTQHFYCCVTAEHDTPPHSCVIQVFIAVA
jgi:hypothetical protein